MEEKLAAKQGSQAEQRIRELLAAAKMAGLHDAVMAIAIAKGLSFLVKELGKCDCSNCRHNQSVVVGAIGEWMNKAGVRTEMTLVRVDKKKTEGM